MPSNSYCTFWFWQISNLFFFLDIHWESLIIIAQVNLEYFFGFLTSGPERGGLQAHEYLHCTLALCTQYSTMSSTINTMSNYTGFSSTVSVSDPHSFSWWSGSCYILYSISMWGAGSSFICDCGSRIKNQESRIQDLGSEIKIKFRSISSRFLDNLSTWIRIHKVNECNPYRFGSEYETLTCSAIPA